MKIYVISILWILSIVGGLISLYNYEHTPGPKGQLAENWNESKLVSEEGSHYQLLMFLHPQCPCSRASMRELEIIMAKTQGKLTAKALFLQPASFDEAKVKSYLWNSAEVIPGVTSIIDHEGVEARRFGATTSGQTLLFDSRGQLRFSGGITVSRGHEGPNPGADAIEEIAIKGSSKIETTPCFGCALFKKPLKGE